MLKTDTIVAIATPPGEGGVAIVRLSGPTALLIAQNLFSKSLRNFESHTAHLGQIKDGEGHFVDEVLLLVFKNGRSYTGEESVEIQCHGGNLIAKRILSLAVEVGARVARPGEFTYRAFLNGKIDLAQAEAVQQFIGAKNERALNATRQHLSGALSETISRFQIQLTEVAAMLEAWIDFPEEDIAFTTPQALEELLENNLQAMKKLHATFNQGKIVQEGLSLCLMGPPNVGKSSLMNALLGKERAIVTPIAGTTRDLLEDHLLMGELHFRLLDTAGLCETQDIIEQEGIRRSRQAMQEADLLLFVLDATLGLTPHVRNILDQMPKEKTIAIWNKCDLPHPPLEALPFQKSVSISALKREGLEELQKAIETFVWKGETPSQDELLLTQARHHEALGEAIMACERVKEGLANPAPELLSLDMRHCLEKLGTIIGRDVTEDILNTIFSKFCIGK